jgi:hypothetical protein
MEITTATGYNYNDHYSTVSFSDPDDGTAVTFHFQGSMAKTDSLGPQRLTDED